jgi:hypothetical protein
MSGEPILLDSVILIDHLNGIEQATSYLLDAGGRAAITAITRAEVLSGVAPEQGRSIRLLLDRFPLIAIDAAIADRAASLRRRHRWKLPDALQAAAALEHGRILVTRNTKDFEPKRHAFVQVPYSV